MIRASHVIFSAYGFWLPNDPRGSWSDFVRSWEMCCYGPATKVLTSQSLAHKPHDHAARQQAKDTLVYTPVEFTGLQAKSVAEGFAHAVCESGYQVHACAVLPEHVHMVIARHQRHVERIVGHLKSRATHHLTEAGRHPFQDRRLSNGRFPPMWGRGCWKVFLNSDTAVHRAIEYVEQNPVKEGKPRQHWSFVVPYAV